MSSLPIGAWRGFPREVVSSSFVGFAGRSFLRLRREQRLLVSDTPDEAREFAGDRDDGLLLAFASAGELSIPTTQPVLRLQVTGSEKASEFDRVACVRLHAITCLHRHQRRRDHDAGDPVLGKARIPSAPLRSNTRATAAVRASSIDEASPRCRAAPLRAAREPSRRHPRLPLQCCSCGRRDQRIVDFSLDQPPAAALRRVCLTAMQRNPRSCVSAGPTILSTGAPERPQ